MSLAEIPVFFRSAAPYPAPNHTNPSFLCHFSKGECLGVNHISNRNAALTLLRAPGKGRLCECFDAYEKLVPFLEAWSWQKSMVREKHALLESNVEFFDSLIVLQHDPVYTLGTGSSKDHLNFDISDAPYDIYQTERGGEVTYHGPGQLVMYPIINLRNHKMDLHWYLRALEEVVIRMLDSTFSINSCRIDGFTGVWVGNQKLAAIGIKVSRWITYHGLALNVTTNLMPFQHIVPCGIRDRQVGSIQTLLGGSEPSNQRETDELIRLAHEGLIREFSEVFQLHLVHKSILSLPSFSDHLFMNPNGKNV